MTDDLIELASAYLDGETTAAERAQVEADAEVLAEVERLRRVRAVLSDTSNPGDTAPISMRERHLAGALDAWDRLPSSEVLGDATPTGADAAGVAGGASITAPTSLRDRRATRRPISTKVLTAAAAVVVIAGAGLVVRSAIDTNDANESTADGAVAEFDASDDAASAEVLAAEEFAADGEAVDETAPAPAADAVESAVQGGPEQPPGNDDLEVLSNDAELAEFANAQVIARTAAVPAAAPADAPEADVAANNDADGAAPAATAPPTLPPPVDRCDLIDDFVGFAYWEAAGLFDDPVAVGIDNSRGDVIAYRDADCTVVARTPLP